MIHALYSDGGTYRVLYDRREQKTYLATTDGRRMDVPHFVGNAEFVRYDFSYQPQPGLRACDIGENMRRFQEQIALLTPPAKPAAPPTPITQQQPEDFRLHVEPGGDSFRALQTAGGNAEAEYRANRERERQAQLTDLNRRDARKIADARHINQEYAALKRPRGGGQGFIAKKNGE